MFLNLHDFEAAAKKRLPACLFGFAAHGSERGASVAANERSFERWQFVPRTLTDVSVTSQSRVLLDVEYAAPFGIAPMGGCALFARGADLLLASAAAAEGVPFILSAASSVPLEEVMAQVPGAWYQGYLPGDERQIASTVARLAAARVGVLVVTVDVPVPSNRDSDKRLGFSIPVRPSWRLAIDGLSHPRWLCATLARTLLFDGMPTLPNFSGVPQGRSIIATTASLDRSDRARFTWEHVAFLRRAWKGRLVIKGILSPADAQRALRSGADAVILSNHGGRQLDGAIAPLDVLPEVVEAAGAMPVCIDGGIRRGTDVVKALALGARFAFIGRPMLYALSVHGQHGVGVAIRMLRAEIAACLALVGAPRVGDLSPELLRRTR